MAENEQGIHDRWMEFLTAEGYRPKLEVNSENPALARVAFKKAAKTHVGLETRDVDLSVEWFAEDLPSSRVFARLLHRCRCAADGFFAKVKEMSRPVTIA